MIKILLAILLPTISYAGFSEVAPSELYNYKQKVVQTVRVKRSARKRSSANKNRKLLQELLKSDRAIAKLLAAKKESLIVKTSSPKITPLTRVRGILLNSVLAMNVTPTTVIIRLGSDMEEIAGGEIRCKAMSFQKRVRGKCDLLVIDEKSYPIDAHLWDTDGAEGLIADYFYSGEEKSFLTSSLSSFFASMLEGAKSKISTPFGNINKTTSKNQLLNGLMGVANNVNQKISDSADSKVEISYVNAGKKALIFFNSGLTLKEEK